jgi:hypothetical protein
MIANQTIPLKVIVTGFASLALASRAYAAPTCSYKADSRLQYLKLEIVSAEEYVIFTHPLAWFNIK